jgi:Uma2 family endonuclease
LESHSIERKAGWTFGSSQGFLVARDPDRLLSPDAAFVSVERLRTIPADAFVEMAPDFALEVRSPTDSLAGALAKGQLWLASGVPVVWVVDPGSRSVIVLRAREAPWIARPGQWIDAAPALPGFRVAVSWIFSEMLGGASLSGPLAGPLPDAEPPAP